MLKVVLTFTLIGMNVHSYAQEKISPRVDLAYYQVGDDLPYVTVRVRKRVERRFIPMAGIPVAIYFNDESADHKMGSPVTDLKGEGRVILPEAMRTAWNDSLEFEFFAAIEASDTTEEADESILIKRARIRVLTDEPEGHKVFKVVLEEKSDDGWLPVEGTDLKVFVKRYFGRLAFGEDVNISDEEGQAEVEFNEELPGDKDGMITLGGMVEDNDDYGTLIAYKSVKWGTPLKDDNSFMGRTLWATRDKTPWWLLIFPNLIILGVWGVIVYLFFQIGRLRKLAKR
jgi:hypothetical protein